MNPFTIKLGDNVSATWDGNLAKASSDWSISEVLDTVVVAGGTTPKPCKAVSGTVQVCDSTYGKTGWLGIAQIWASGFHITKAVSKMNDTYFNKAPYNTDAWRQFVMCQEVGHTFGLAHQDENFSNPNLGSCMDYTSDPSTNQHPNRHDYDQLALIYSHLDSFNSYNSSLPSSGTAGPAFGQDGDDWGRAVHADGKGRPNIFVKDEGGARKITWVYWADAN